MAVLSGGQEGERTDSRLWLIERLRVRLEELAAAGPVLVTLDDLQWADTVTVLALRLLPGELMSYGLAWLLARLPGPGDPAVTRLAETLRQTGAACLELAPIDASAVAALVGDLVGATPDPGLLAQVSRADGNPFHVVELITALKGEKALAIEDGTARLDSARLPRRFQQIVRQVLDGLSAPARQLLDVAAVLGYTFSLDELADVLEEPVTRLLPVLREMVDAGALTYLGESVAFKHHLVWEAVIETVPAPVRAALHRKVGEVLRARGDSPVRVAEHLMRGARPGDLRAVDTLSEAAVEIRGADPQAAAQLAVRALELGGRADPRRAERVITAVECLTSARRLREATDLARSTLASDLPAAQAAQLRTALGLALMVAGRAREAVTEMESVLALGGLTADGRDLASAVHLAAMVTVDQAADVRPGLERLCTAAEERSDATTFVFAATELAWVGWDQARAADALDAARSAAARLGGARLMARLAHPLFRLASMLFHLRDLDDGEEVLRAAEREAELIGDATQAVTANVLRAYARLVAGRLDDAVAEAEAGLAIGAEMGGGMFVSRARTALAGVALRRGDLRLAREHLRHSEEHLALASWGLAQHLWLSGQVADASGGASAAMDAVVPAISAGPALRMLLVEEPASAAWLVRAASRAGRANLAVQVTATAADVAETNPALPALVTAALHAQGVLGGDAAKLRAAVDSHRDPWATGSAAEDLARLLADRGQRGDAVASYEHAVAVYERSGAARDAARVRSRLRELGVRHRHWKYADRPLTGWASLTDTEESVARLVAQGLTNRQAADQMFLSPHTIVFHLRQVFRKLGVTSRVELTRFIAERDAASPVTP